MTSEDLARLFPFSRGKRLRPTIRFPFPLGKGLGVRFPRIVRDAYFTVPAYGPAPLTVGFFVSSLNPDAAPITSYIWNFGDGQVSMLPPTALFHTYTNPGSYIVNVTVSDSGGHQASSFAAVIVAQPMH